MSSTPLEPSKRVYLDKSSIRRVFNDARIWERVQAGEYQTIIRRDSPCPYADEPPGTRAQVRLIVDGNNLVAIVHGYWRPDGTLGASGLPDPKKVVHGGMTYCLAGSGRPPAAQEQDD